eukprot:11474733-Alexandrium_andersonii.AAC.1
MRPPGHRGDLSPLPVLDRGVAQQEDPAGLAGLILGLRPGSVVHGDEHQLAQGNRLHRQGQVREVPRHPGQT